MSAEHALLVITDPAARSADGESVRVALDVIRAAAPVKLSFPEDRDELERALARRGRRRVVVIAGERGVHSVATALRAQGALGDTPLGIVPIDTGAGLALAARLGLPAEPAKAARVALGDRERALDLLVDDVGGVALRQIRIGHGVRRGAAAVPAGRRRPWLDLLGRAAHQVHATMAQARAAGQRLRVEADGRVLADLDRPVLGVHVGCGAPGPDAAGDAPRARVRVTACEAGARFRLPVQARGRDDSPDGLAAGAPAPDTAAVPAARDGHDAHEGAGHLVEVSAREITVWGSDFTYESDGLPRGPVRMRTWTLHPRGWRLYVPD